MKHRLPSKMAAGGNPSDVIRKGLFDMPETCENWPGLVNSHIYYAHQTHEIYQVLPYSTDFKARGSFEIHWVRQYLVSVVCLE